MYICDYHHRSIESNRTDAYEQGWLVPYAGDPGAVPIIIGNSMVMLFDDEHASLRTDPLIDVDEWAQP